MRKAHLLAATALLGLATAHTARAGSLYAFGDSLSDNGNLYKLIDYPPAALLPRADSPTARSGWNICPASPASVSPRRRTTPMAAPSPATSSIDGVDYGTNLVAPSVPGINTEIADFAAAGGRFSSTDVVTLWGGANNYFKYADVVEANPPRPARSSPPASPPPSPSSPPIPMRSSPSAPARSSCPTCPISAPRRISTPAPLGTDLGDAFSTLHDQYLPGADGRPCTARPGANIIVLNTQQLLDNVIANPSFYGFSNVTDACIDTPPALTATPRRKTPISSGTACIPPPRAQQIIAEYAAASLHGFESLSVPARLGTTDAQQFSTVAQQPHGGAARRRHRLHLQHPAKQLCHADRQQHGPHAETLHLHHRRRQFRQLEQ